MTKGLLFSLTALAAALFLNLSHAHAKELGDDLLCAPLTLSKPVPIVVKNPLGCGNSEKKGNDANAGAQCVLQVQCTPLQPGDKDKILERAEKERVARIDQGDLALSQDPFIKARCEAYHLHTRTVDGKTVYLWGETEIDKGAYDQYERDFHYIAEYKKCFDKHKQELIDKKGKLAYDELDDLEKLNLLRDNRYDDPNNTQKAKQDYNYKEIKEIKSKLVPTHKTVVTCPADVLKDQKTALCPNPDRCKAASNTNQFDGDVSVLGAFESKEIFPENSGAKNKKSKVTGGSLD